MRRLIASLLLAALPISAKPPTLTLDWSEFRQVVEHVDFRQRVAVRTGEEGRERVRGKLEGASDSGITIAKKGSSSGAHTWIERERVYSVRLYPKKRSSLKWRALAVAGAFPLWIVGLTLGLSIPDGIPEGRWYKNRNRVQGIIGGFGLPLAVYALAHRADRHSGAMVLELKKGKENLK